MACDIKYDNIIFSVYKKSRFNNNEVYVFIGVVEEKIKKIFDKLEKRETIIKDDILLLKDKYPHEFMDWINFVKSKIKIKFINNKIHIDETISEIRKKIFVFISDFDKKDFITPENQEIWMEKEKTGVHEIIGYNYENIETKDKELTKPHVYENFNFKNNYYFDKNKYKKITAENNILIYDLINELKLKSLIYVSDAKEEEKYLKSKKVNITEGLIKNYFRKYWPYVNLSYDVNEVKNNYILLKEYFEKEEYIYKLINNIDINKNEFGSCNIFTANIGINENSILFTNSGEKEYIDLFPVFDYVKDNKIGHNIPFVKYSEELFEAPFYIISKKAIDSKNIDKKVLSKWLGIDNDEQRKMNGLLVKKFIREFDGKPRYYTIIIDKYGIITLLIAFDRDNNATFDDIEYVVKDCKDFINDINKNRIVKKIGEKVKLEPPELTFKDSRLYLKENTKITFMNVIVPLNLGKSIDYKSLYDFSKKFPHFVVDFPKSVIKKIDDKNKIHNSLKIKYKRISRFANMSDILYEIDKLKDKQLETSVIIKLLEKKYQKSIDEIKSYLIEWERKYSSSKSSKISSEFKEGILVTITDKNILINGITKVYQIPLIYKFFTTFLTLFLNYDVYIKDTQFKKFFYSKNLNNTTEIFANKYEYNTNVKLNLTQLHNINIDFELDDINSNYSNSGIILHEMENDDTDITKILSTKQIVGIGKNSDIDPQIKLDCDDAIIEKDTCEDFCNDPYYYLRRLQRYDTKLFRPNVGKKEKESKTYPRICQAFTQPVVLSENPDTNPNIKRESYTYSIKYSSDPNLFERWYICPQVWCPICEIPILEADIDPKTIRIRAMKEKGKLCKTAICPYGNHQVMLRTKDNKNYKYPGFVKNSTHPDGLCLPCCYLLPDNIPKSGKYKSFKKCLGDDVENQIVKEGKIYILGKGIPIDKDRYGKLTYEIERLLKTRLESGDLGLKKGYLRRGINHEKNNSFLSTISDILSCDKINQKLSVKKIKLIITDKLNDTLFKSLYAGNIVNIFKTIDNFKNFILNENIEINHKYLWDFLQRPGILFEDGINIFIFENNRLLCPKGENVKYFFDKNKKNILLIKSKDYYEPIYYLEGNGKTADITCVFDNTKEEIRKIYELSQIGCVSKFDINWCEVLKDNIKKYDLNIDNIIIEDGNDLQDTLNQLLTAIQNKKLKDDYIPEMQYIDSYNKVFAIGLKNGLYLPVSPTKLNEKIKYKIIFDINDIDKINIKNTINFTNEIKKNTNLKCNITHKILDIKNKKNIIALVSENNRFIPIIQCPDILKNMKVSYLNYYSDVDESLYNKIEKIDKRIEIMNKKNYEDETYMRLKFELAKFIQLKDNKSHYDKIMEVINSDDKNITKSRGKMYILLNNIFSNLITTKNNSIDFFDYKTPNKRIPCNLRNIRKNKNFKDSDVKLLCEDDPHCTVNNNKCKLFINEINLIHKDRKINNYDFYLSKIVDELLRFKLKRLEILKDNIPTIINKEKITEDKDKYVVIHSINNTEIEQIVNKLFYNNNGIFIDNRSLYEDITTKEVTFKKEKYLLGRLSDIQNNRTNDLSGYWIKILGNKFKVKPNEDNSLFSLMILILNFNEYKNNLNNAPIDIDILKNKIIIFINSKKNKQVLINLYKKNSKMKNVTNLQSLHDEILNQKYSGDESDLDIISQMYNINFLILDKRIKKNSNGLTIIKSKNFKTDNFILLYKTTIFDKNIFNLIQFRGKILLRYNDLPEKFCDMAFGIDDNK